VTEAEKVGVQVGGLTEAVHEGGDQDSVRVDLVRVREVLPVLERVREGVRVWDPGGLLEPEWLGGEGDLVGLGGECVAVEPVAVKVEWEALHVTVHDVLGLRVPLWEVVLVGARVEVMVGVSVEVGGVGVKVNVRV